MSIRSFFEYDLAERPGNVFVTYRQDGEVRSRTYAESGKRVAAISEFVASLGIEPRKAPVAIILENSPVWMEVYLGLASLAVPVVPVDPKLRAGEIEYMMGDSGVVAIVTDAKHSGVLKEIAPRLPKLTDFVFVDGEKNGAPKEIDGRRCHDLEQEIESFSEKGNGPESVLKKVAVKDEDIASIIYTSGTTGRPKGALISHGNFCSDVTGCAALFPSLSQEDSFFVVLPLFHGFSFTTNFLVTVYAGCSACFATSLRTIPEDMRDMHPSLMMSVPLMVEKIYAKIQDGLKKSVGARILSFFGLRGLIAYFVCKTLGGRLRLLVVGGAPCSAKLLKSMRRMHLPIIEGYGLTEASPVVSVSQIDNVHVGTIGIPLPNVEVKIGDMGSNGVGELLVRGPTVFQGYLNKPDATAETIEDGWLHTGDLVSQDADGFLTIRGRRKSLIVNREGKNIYPEEVETCIGHDRRIQDVVVVGYLDTPEDVGEKVGAIIVPNLEAFKDAAGRLPAWDIIEEKARKAAFKCCNNLAAYKTPRKIEVYREPLERTSTQKVRRYLYQGKLNG